MRDLDKASGKPSKIATEPKALAAERAVGVNQMNTDGAPMAQVLQRLNWQRWNADNQQAIDACNERGAIYGLPLAPYRTWGPRLGDGKLSTG